MSVGSRASTYHPSLVYFARKKDHEVKELAILAVKSEDAAKKDGKDVKQDRGDRPPGVAGILFDALGYLDNALAVLLELHAKYDELVALNEEALNPKLADKDRKPISKKFTKVKLDFDRISKLSSIGGDALFSGKFSQLIGCTS